MTTQKNIVIFGGTGFIGTAVAHAFVENGARVTCVSRHADASKNTSHITYLRCDARDGKAVSAICEGADAVIISIGILYETKHMNFTEAHSAIPGIIATEAARAGVKRLVHISALGAAEHSPSAYARSKIDGEYAVRSAFPDATVLRPSIVFGSRDNFFNMFARMSRFAPALPLIGGGHTLFAPVYVDDVAACTVAAVTRSDMNGTVITCAGPRTYSFKELLTYIGAVTGRKRALVPLPFAVAEKLGAVMRRILPHPPLTDDQVRLLKTDNIAPPNAIGMQSAGITPTTVESIVPSYLS